MPTSPRSTVVPLRRATRARLEALRGGRTFDEAILDLLDAAGPLALLAAAPREAPTPRETASRRSPAKQALLARVAAAAWRRSVEEGALVRRGPRALDWTPPPRAQEKLDVEQDRRRGL